MKSELIALSALNTLCAFNFQLSTARATRLTLRLLVVLLLVLPAVAQAQFSYDGFWYSTNNGTATITGDNSASGAVTIPSSIPIFPNNVPVTSIGTNAFSYVNEVTSVTIPDSVTSIGDSAFYSCSLTSITIGHGVTSIGTNAFAGCYNLKSVTIPDNVTHLGAYAFYYSSLTNATIGNGVTSIGSG